MVLHIIEVDFSIIICNSNHNYIVKLWSQVCPPSPKENQYANLNLSLKDKSIIATGIFLGCLFHISTMHSRSSSVIWGGDSMAIFIKFESFSPQSDFLIYFFVSFICARSFALRRQWRQEYSSGHWKGYSD